MLEELWNGILELTAQFVIPDWGALIALLPVFIFVLVLVGLVWMFVRLLRAPTAQRGKRRVTPRTPPELHMPGPSFAPILASIGVFLFFLGVVFPGPLLMLGAIALGLTLLYWLGESVRIFDHDLGIRTRTVLPAVAHEGPPPGVHMPGPSFRPFLGAVGTGMLMLGLVFGGWLLAAGVIALVATLVGWLFDARKEYVKTVEADITGHLENVPAPRAPTGLLVTLAVLLLVGVVLQAGWLPPRDVSGGDGATASGVPEADVVVHAKNLAFAETSLTAPADQPFTLALVNEDAGTPHNVEFTDGGGTSVYKGEIFPGVETRVYDVPALPSGTYTFLCTVHPSMTGSATLQ